MAEKNDRRNRVERRPKDSSSRLHRIVCPGVINSDGSIEKGAEPARQLGEQ
jgi:hypothetical protein